MHAKLCAKKIGVWGVGVVGKSVLKYLCVKGCTQIGVLDRRALTPQEELFFKEHNITFFRELTDKSADKSATTSAKKFTGTPAQICKQTCCDSGAHTHAHNPGHECPHISSLACELEHTHACAHLCGHVCAHACAKENFLKTYDVIIPSAGIDLRPYHEYRHKWLSEADLFCDEYQKPIVAITGTVGKTSITSLLSELLQATGLRVATGGNIGVGMPDLLQQQSDMAVLELSSFQLDVVKTFAPTLAIVTNIYPNHLDRHGTFEEYRAAKYKIFGQDRRDHAVPGVQFLLAPVEICHDIMRVMTYKNNFGAHTRCAFFSPNRPTLFEAPARNCVFYYFDKTGDIIREQSGIAVVLVQAHELPDVSYKINWLIICAAFDLLTIDFSRAVAACSLAGELAIPDHRLHHLACVNHVDFYDDSKSTVPQATVAALEKLSGRPTIALIGGLSKGVDRKLFFVDIKKYVKRIICFGAEAATLHDYATQAGIMSEACPTLEAAFESACAHTRAGDQVVLSPAGSSFDLFANYHARGVAFQKLVATRKSESKNQ